MPAGEARHLLSLADLRADDITALVGRSVQHASARPEATLRDKVVGVYFRRTSTRTRTAFSVAAARLGAQVVAYGPDDLQENTGETFADTGRVLSSMLDALVARTADDPGELRDICGQRRMAVVNAMTSDEHPTQAIADLSTLHQVLGRIDHVRVLYLGEGNNTASALALALASFPGNELHLLTPRGYGVLPDKLRAAEHRAARHGALVRQSHDPFDLPATVDVVYTTRWQTTGTVKDDSHWRDTFRPFGVDAALMRRFPGALFLHDLPAHRGEEVTADVLDGPASKAFLQAEHKLYSAMAVLEWCLGEAGR
ncbi:ornithine carbamoyltransferase [Streptomyces olivaceoviridis]|uniref:ornithine carbamoyltransferase n=1 Tax=Streptomyces olivaceoviridis TaxID=1921 RepID=UPI0036FACFC9